MTAINIIPQQMLPAPELIAAMTGAPATIGTLLFSPIKLVLDNQSTSSVVLSINVGGSGSLVQWKTFSAGEALVLDDDMYSFPIGTVFSGNGAATGNFSISYTYINYPGYP
jgi:hypothetical protein